MALLTRRRLQSPYNDLPMSPAPLQPPTRSTLTPPAAPVEQKPLLGGNTFRLLKSRNPVPGAATPASDPNMVEEQSYAGVNNYLDEQVGGAPRRLSGFRGRRAGARFTEGAMKGRTLDQAKLIARDRYAALPDDVKQQYERKARNEDISVPVRRRAIPTLPQPTGTPTTSIDGSSLLPVQNGQMGMRPRRLLAPAPDYLEDEDYGY